MRETRNGPGKPEQRLRHFLQLRGCAFGGCERYVSRTRSADEDVDECRSLEELEPGERCTGAVLERAVTYAGHVGCAFGLRLGVRGVVQRFAVRLHTDDERAA